MVTIAGKIIFVVFALALIYYVWKNIFEDRSDLRVDKGRIDYIED